MIPLVVHNNINFDDLELFSNFSGKIDNRNEKDKLSVFEIPIDKYIS